MLMGLGSLATIGVQKPQNLAVIVFDNGVYGETGGQPSHTAAGGINLVAVAQACHFALCLDLHDEQGVVGLAARLSAFAGPLFARIAINADEPPRVLPERDGGALKRRFRAALSQEG
jgi:phosphonopyruvate decarboxylase